MNYGTIGFLAEGLDSFYLAYPKEILSAFSLSNASKLYGVYYPCPKGGHKAYNLATSRNDFIITPIPPELWKASARIQLEIKNDRGTLKALYEYLRDRKISMIHAESSRSSYRYASWSAHIVFEELLEQKLTFDSKHNCFAETHEQVKKLAEELRTPSEKNKFLFVHNNARVEVEVIPNHSLAYYANYRNESNVKLAHFELVVHNSETSLKLQVLKGNETFRRIILGLQNNNHEILPATTFSELDTKSLNLRTSIIFNNDAKRFFKVCIKYSRSGETATCVGIVHDIALQMNPMYSLWHTYNRIIDYNYKSEIGEIIFLIEDTSVIEPHLAAGKELPLEDDREDYINDAENHFEKKIRKHFNDLYIKGEKDFNIDNVKVRPLPQKEIVKEILIEDSRSRLNREYEYDLFISYSHLDAEHIDKFEELAKAKNLEVHRDVRAIEYGAPITDELLKNLKGSREMCVFISKNSVDSPWVLSEIGAAWVLNKIITPVILDKDCNVPQIISNLKHVKWNQPIEIDEFLKRVNYRMANNSAKDYSKTFPK